MVFFVFNYYLVPSPAPLPPLFCLVKLSSLEREDLVDFLVVAFLVATFLVTAFLVATFFATTFLVTAFFVATFLVATFFFGLAAFAFVVVLFLLLDLIVAAILHSPSVGLMKQ